MTTGSVPPPSASAPRACCPLHIAASSGPDRLAHIAAQEDLLEDLATLLLPREEEEKKDWEWEEEEAEEDSDEDEDKHPKPECRAAEDGPRWALAALSVFARRCPEAHERMARTEGLLEGLAPHLNAAAGGSMRRRSCFVLATMAAPAAVAPRAPAPAYLVKALVQQLGRSMDVAAGLTTIMERGRGDALAQRAAATLADVAFALTAPLSKRVAAVAGLVAALKALARDGAESDAQRALLNLGCAEAEGPKPKKQRRR
jgi:hypothetical protein